MFDYYLPPDQDVFDDIKQACIKVWSQYDDSYNYATEKINRIKNLANVQGNAWHMIGMLDIFNQKKVLQFVNEKTALKIEEMMPWSRDQLNQLI